MVSMALRRKDYSALAAAVRREKQIIQAHRVLIAEQRAALAELRQRVFFDRP